MCHEPTTVIQEQLHCREPSGVKYSKIMTLDIFSLTAKSIRCFSALSSACQFSQFEERIKITCLPSSGGVKLNSLPYVKQSDTIVMSTTVQQRNRSYNRQKKKNLRATLNASTGYAVHSVRQRCFREDPWGSGNCAVLMHMHSMGWGKRGRFSFHLPTPEH